MRGKIVRKLAAAGLSAVVAVSASVPVFAADKSYSISEIGDMNISLPEDITVIDRNAPDSAEYFKLFGLDYNTVMSQMDSNNVYLQGMDSTASLTVTVSMTESADSQELENYNLLSSEQLGDIARNFLSQPEYTACRIDEAGKPVTWLSFDTNVGGVKAYLANTVYDGRSINLTLHLRGIERQLRHKELFTEILALPRDSGGSADSSPRSAHTYNKNRPLAQDTEEAAEGKRQDTRGAFGQVLAPHSRQALGRRQPRGDEGHSRSEQDRTSRTRGGSARRSTARTRRTAADAARGRCGGL